MPNSETLQLYFEPLEATGQNGLFAADTLAHRSEVWIDQDGQSIPDKRLAIDFGDQVFINVEVAAKLPANWQYLDINGSAMRITAVLWRNHSSASRNDAIYDSPFADAAGRVSTVFDQFYTAAQCAAGPATLVLGTPQLSSGVPGGQDRYLFLLVMTLHLQDDQGAPQTFTAGRDPQMDVGM